MWALAIDDGVVVFAVELRVQTSKTAGVPSDPTYNPRALLRSFSLCASSSSSSFFFSLSLWRRQQQHGPAPKFTHPAGRYHLYLSGERTVRQLEKNLEFHLLSFSTLCSNQLSIVLMKHKKKLFVYLLLFLLLLFFISFSFFFPPEEFFIVDERHRGKGADWVAVVDRVFMVHVNTERERARESTGIGVTGKDSLTRLDDARERSLYGFWGFLLCWVPLLSNRLSYWLADDSQGMSLSLSLSLENPGRQRPLSTSSLLFTLLLLLFFSMPVS